MKVNLSALHESAYETVDLLKHKLIGDLSADEHTCILAWLCRECSETRVISKELDTRVLKLEQRRKDNARITGYRSKKRSWRVSRNRFHSLG